MSECLLYYIKDGLTRWAAHQVGGSDGSGVPVCPCVLEAMLPAAVCVALPGPLYMGASSVPQSYASWAFPIRAWLGVWRPGVVGSGWPCGHSGCGHC